MTTITIGTDVEMFLFDNEQGRVVPSVGILPGTKDNPHQMDGYPKGYAIQEDNVMVEFNIPPQRNYAGFRKAIAAAKQGVLAYLTATYGTKYALYEADHNFKFAAADLKAKQAQTIGCDPDFDAYEGGAIRTNPPLPGLDRSCGGHIHLGVEAKCPDFVIALFLELFLAFRAGLVVQPGDKRAFWYGRPGIYRPKPYGIEYRTPSNAWAVQSTMTDYVGETALYCGKWIQDQDAISLQRTFRSIPWVKLREYMTSDHNSEASSRLRTNIHKAAINAGVSL